MTRQDILIVDDDPGTIKALGAVLAEVGRIRIATNGKEALTISRQAVPDLILLDAELPDLTGFQVCQKLKTDREFADVPIIFLTSHSDVEFEIASLDLGASDFIAKPINAALLLARVKAQLRVKAITDELSRVVRNDALTGLPSRGHFDQSLDREWLRAMRSGEPMCLLLLNVDHFAAYNHRYGYAEGEKCLQTFAHALQLACLRPADLAARLGGEDFALLLPQTARAGAAHMAQRITSALETLRIAHDASTTASHVTVSIGIGCYDNETACWSTPSVAWRAQQGNLARAGASDLLKAATHALTLARQSSQGSVKLQDTVLAARN